MEHLIAITTPFIRLDQLLKHASIVGSGGDAKFLIVNGFVKYNGEEMLMRGKKCFSGDIITILYEGNHDIIKVK